MRVPGSRLASAIGARFPARPASLRTQLIAWNIAALLVLLGALGIFARYITRAFIMDSVDRELSRGIAMFQRPFTRGPRRDDVGFRREGPPAGRQLERDNPGGGAPAGTTPIEGQPPGDGSPSGGPPPRDDRMRRPRRNGPPDASNPYHPRLFRSDGSPGMPGEQRVVWDESGLKRALHGATVWSTVTVDDEPLRVISGPASGPTWTGGAAQYAYPLKDVFRLISGVDTALLLMIPIGGAGAWWVGSVITNRILRRVQRMTQAAGKIGAEDLSRRLPASGGDEFAELAQTFNGMLDRLDTAFEEQKRMLALQRRFTADASHELKTPLTIVKGSASFALGRPSTDEASLKTFREINEAADTMSSLVQDLLLLAKLDAGQMGSNRIEVFARELLERAVSQTAREQSPVVRVSVEPEELTLEVNEAEMVRLIRNLLDNAIHHTPQDGCIRLAAVGSANGVEISVSDSGSGIPPEHLEHLGERFYRVDSARARTDGGTGLGLSICKGIAEAHGGSLSVESTVGVGTTVRIMLPVPSGCDD